ncbi:MAG: hypothetical protein B0A82_16595 [Alkalinema sp. CACIAM 70d]|nr:MAG: hypothetical protein B0A82_16595 [Alkalinema sp. CACIAM 70d]
MELYCTRPGCQRPQNFFGELSDPGVLKATRQKFCTNCGMPLILADRYLPEKLLGQGGFGAAYLARDRYTPGMRRCVVKQFKPAAQLNPTQLQLAHDLFVREAEILEKIGQDHFQIPDLYAFFDLDVPGSNPSTTETYFYIVQEYIDGEDLEQELHRRGAFSEAEVREVLKSMLEVLSFVHEGNTIHRDIKPSNIMRSRKGRLYLLDFGAIKVAAASSASPGQKASTSIFSPGYAPPEQMAGGEVFFSTDLYSLAVTCLELLTGKSPTALYDASTNSWQWQRYATIGEPLATILRKMLQHSPSDRYWSAAEVLLALQPQQKPSQVMPPPPMPSAPSTTALQSPPPPVPAPTPARSSARKPAVQSTPAIVPSAPPRSTLAILGSAAFTGFEGGLLAIVLYRLPLPIPLEARAIAWLALALMLVFLQYRRTIEKIDLVIIAALTGGLVWWFLRPVLAYWMGALLLAGGCLIVTIFFLLIYRLFSAFF